MIDDLCEVAHISNRFICVRHKALSSNQCLMLIFAYAPPMENQKQNFLDEIAAFIMSCSIPCVLIGDLNEIGCPDDKLGGTNNAYARCCRLPDFINKCDLIDLLTTGGRYTWRKNASEVNNIYEKLDRVLVHPDAIQRLPHLATHNHVFTTSDHALISLDLSSNTQHQAQPDRKSTRLNSSHRSLSRMPSSA